MEVFTDRVKDLKNKLARPIIGIALGSGAARGLAHIGVLEVFQKEGIPIDVYSGTSIGSVIGGLVLAGWPPEFLGKFAKAIQRQHILASLDFVIPPKRGLIEGYHVEKMLERMLKIKTVEELPKPFATVSSDITTGERVVHDSGSLVKSIRASISVPGVFVPYIDTTVDINSNQYGRMLVDGAIVDPVPMDILYEAGVDIVIGINIMRRPSKGKLPDGILDVLLNMTDIMGFQIFESKTYKDPIIIEPLKEYSFGGMEFDKANELIELGKAAAIEAIPFIKERLKAEGVI